MSLLQDKGIKTKEEQIWISNTIHARHSYHINTSQTVELPLPAMTTSWHWSLAGSRFNWAAILYIIDQKTNVISVLLANKPRPFQKQHSCHKSSYKHHQQKKQDLTLDTFPWMNGHKPPRGNVMLINVLSCSVLAQILYDNLGVFQKAGYVTLPGLFMDE